MAITCSLERAESAGGGRSVPKGKKNFAELNKSLKERDESCTALETGVHIGIVQQQNGKGSGLGCMLEAYSI